jgi:hypothetical protein
MTLPYEEYNAILAATRFLYDLMDPQKTPRVPKWVRVEARRRVKHLPLQPILAERYKDALGDCAPPGWSLEMDKSGPSLMARHFPDPTDAPVS